MNARPFAGFESDHTGGGDLLALYGAALFADDPFNNSGIVECCCHYLLTVFQSPGVNSQVGKVGEDTVYLGQLGVILYLAAFGAKCKGLGDPIIIKKRERSCRSTKHSLFMVDFSVVCQPPAPMSG